MPVAKIHKKKEWGPTVFLSEVGRLTRELEPQLQHELDGVEFHLSNTWANSYRLGADILKELL